MSPRRPLPDDTLLERAARAFADENALRAPTNDEARRLVHRAGERPRRGAWRWAGALALAAASITAGVFYIERAEAPVRVLVERGGDRREVQVDATGLSLSADVTPIIVTSGADRVLVDSHSKARLNRGRGKRTEVELGVGRVVCHVEKRSRAEFEVSTGTHRVRVLGTQFSVTLAGDVLDVAVAEGTVQVDGPGGLTLHAGDTARLSRGETTRAGLSAEQRASVMALTSDVGVGSEAVVPTPAPVAPIVTERAEVPVPAERREPPVPVEQSREAGKARPAAPDLAAIQDRVLAGEVKQAIADLEHYVGQNPRSAEAWSLLGDTRRKAGRYRDAVAAYAKVMRVGDHTEGNRARFLSATVLYDNLHDPKAAARLLRQYLGADAGFQALRGAAMLRLARCLVAMKEIDEARLWLRQVVEQFPGTAEAQQAYALEAEL